MMIHWAVDTAPPRSLPIGPGATLTVVASRVIIRKPREIAASPSVGLRTIYRIFGRWMKAITREWQLYPVGVLFGLEFDTATEVALLATTALLASQHIPWYASLCLPILFTAGMTLMDTVDGLFMNLAYGWAFFNPVRKVYYNLAITDCPGGGADLDKRRHRPG